MRIILLHKPSAGDGAFTRASLVDLFEKYDHSVLYYSTDDIDWPDVLNASADLVVAAGGDGTVETVATRLVNKELPLLILPLGTANNIASRLGLKASPELLIQHLPGAARKRFDIGVAHGPWGVQYFVDSMGVGAFTRAMEFIRTERGRLLPPSPNRIARLKRDLQVLHTILQNFDALRCMLVIVGEPEETTYLLLEITNTGHIGPNVELAVGADCGDGLLEVVVVKEAERFRLKNYLEARLRGEEPDSPHFPVRHATSVRLKIDAVRVHIDGKIWPAGGEAPPAAGVPFEVEVNVEPRGLEVLVPCLDKPGILPIPPG
jgi:diacylglycerol kinase family enzyme